MRLLLVTDAWEPQVNGVVRTLRTVVGELRDVGHEVEVVNPQLFKTIPCPTYPEISLALLPKKGIRQVAERFRPTAIHIATEGPLGLAARSLCKKHGWPFTTSFHTRFPEYVHERAWIPTSWTYRAMRWFHSGADRMMVATESIQRELESRGFGNAVRWSRGVDTELFRPFPAGERLFDHLPRPIHMVVGRVAVEKNIEAFLELELDGSKVVVGDGPQRPELQRRFPDVHFAGAKHGEELARHYASGDIFCFPSRTDTFGLVMLEALASGMPVAAYPVPGPLDVVGGTEVGVLDEDLAAACRKARDLSPEACREFALRHSWSACAELFHSHLSEFAA